MKKMQISPQDVLLTEDNDSPYARIQIKQLEEYAKIVNYQLPPIILMEFKEFGERYPIFNGNKRATLAKEKGQITIDALVIRNFFDYIRAEKVQPTSWHQIDYENYYRYNGKFSLDWKLLIRQGMILYPPYIRARKRIKERAKLLN